MIPRAMIERMLNAKACGEPLRLRICANAHARTPGAPLILWLRENGQVQVVGRLHTVTQRKD
jgi:hypothetical protein